MISILVNGQAHRYKQAPLLADLLREMALADKRIAVERNGAIVPRSRFGEARLADGDRLEIVVAVGGG